MILCIPNGAPTEEELLSNRWQFFFFGKYSRSH